MPPDIQGSAAGGTTALVLLWGFWLASYALFPGKLMVDPGYFILSIATSLFAGTVVGRYVFQKAMGH